MHIDEKIHGEVAVVTLAGELLFDEDDTTLQRKIESLTSDGISKVIIDLGKVNRINSRGLSALVSAVKKVQRKGGVARLAQIDKHLKDIFIQTKLVQFFDTYETVGRAMAGYVH